MKLLLDPSHERNSSITDPQGFLEVFATLPQDKEPVDAVADYLRGIKNYALKDFGFSRKLVNFNDPKNPHQDC